MTPRPWWYYPVLVGVSALGGFLGSWLGRR